MDPIELDTPAPATPESRYGLVESVSFACMIAPNLGEALQRAVRFIRIFATAAWQLECTDGLAQMTFQRESGTGERWHAADLFALAELVGGGRQKRGVHWFPKSVQLTQLEPADAAPRPAVTFAADVLALPMRRADTDFFGYFDAQAEALLEATPGDDAVVSTRRAILEGLRGATLPCARLPRYPPPPRAPCAAGSPSAGRASRCSSRKSVWSSPVVTSSIRG